jgi:dienelactone hydrolase
METAWLVAAESGEPTSDTDILAQHGDARSSNWSRVKLGVLTSALALAAGVVAYTCSSRSAASFSHSNLKGVTAEFHLSDWVAKHKASQHNDETPVETATEEYWYSVDHERSDLGHKLLTSLNHLTSYNATTYSGDTKPLPLSPAWSTKFPNSSTVTITWDLSYDDSDDDALYDLYMPEEALKESNGTGLKVVVFMPGTSNEKEKQKFGCQMIASWGRICMAMQHGDNKMKSGTAAMMYAGIANWTSTDDKTYPNCKDTCTDEDSCSKWACTGCPKCYVNEVDLIGYSDGGITAFNMAMDDDYNSYFSKVVIMEGASDKNDPNPNTPPMLIMHTENDPTVTFNGVDDFVQAQEKTGAITKHIYWEDGFHWPFKWADWAWEINRFLTDPASYNYTKWDSVDYFGTWETISETNGCLENDEGITPFASYYITKHIDLCEGMCEEVKGCKAIDYLTGLAYKRPSSDDSPTNPNCYLYYEACKNPKQTFDSDSGVTIESAKLNTNTSVALPVRSASPIEK